MPASLIVIPSDSPPEAAPSSSLGGPRRRALVLGGAAAWLGAAGTAPAQQRKPVEPLLLGMDDTLQRSGLGPRLVQMVGRGTGLPVQAVAGDPAALLVQLERGELHAALTGLQAQETVLEQKGLVFDRRPVAQNQYVIAGPGGRKGDPAKVRGQADVAQALGLIAAAGAQGLCSFIANTHGGALAAEAALWKAAGAQGAGAWLKRPAGSGLHAASALELARAENAYVLVERGLWAAAGRGLEVLAQGDARMAVAYHVMSSFRTRHPGGRLFTQWIAGPQGRAAVGAFGGGYSAPAKA